MYRYEFVPRDATLHSAVMPQYSTVQYRQTDRQTDGRPSVCLSVRSGTVITQVGIPRK